MGSASVTRLQRLAGNRAVAGALAQRNPPAPPGTNPRDVLDQSVIRAEISEVTGFENVQARPTASGAHLLVPQNPAVAPPPVPKPEPRAGPTRPAPSRLAEHRVRGKQEISAALSTARAGSPVVAGGEPAVTPPAPAQQTAAVLVAPSAPDALRAQLPTSAPPEEDLLADLADTRSAAERKAQADAEVAGLSSEGERHKMAVTADAETHRAAVRRHGQEQKATVQARLAARRAELTQRSQGKKAMLQSGAERAKAALAGDVEQDVAALGQLTQSRIAEARAALAERRRTLTDASGAEGTGAQAAAEAESARAVAELEAQAVACERGGEAEADRFPGSEDPKPKQRDAARKVGRDSAADIRAKKTSIGAELRGNTAEHTRRCAEYVRGVLGKLAEAEQALIAELRDAGAQAQGTVRTGLAGVTAAVDGRLRQDLAGVEAAATVAGQQLETAARQSLAELDTGIAGAERELGAGVESVHRELDNTTEETTAVLSPVQRPFLPGVAEQAQAARAGMSALAIGAGAQLSVAAQGAGEQFTAVTTSFDTSAGTLLERVGGQHDQVVAGFTAMVGQVTSSRAAQAAEITAGLRARHSETCDGVLGEVDRAVSEARAQLADMSGQHRRGVRQAADRGIEEASRPRTDDVNTRAREAGEQVDQGWLAGLGRALVQIAIGLVVMVVVALVVAAIAAMFGVFLTAWTAVMIAGAILLAAGLIYSLIQRSRQRELQGRPGMIILMALSDTVGITGIIEGIRGKELFTDRQLSAADRTERGVLGAVTLVSIVLGVRSAIKGPPGGAFTRPVEVPGGWRGLFPRMGEGVGGVAVEMWTGLKGGLKGAWERVAGGAKEVEPGPGRPRPEVPQDVPRTPTGDVDFAAWETRLRAKGVGGDLDARLARARAGDADAIAELRTAERYADAGYDTGLATPKENAGVRNPDIDAQHPGARPPANDPVKVEVKNRATEPITRNSLNTDVSTANKQIKAADPTGAQRGDIIVDASQSPAGMDRAQVESFLRGKMRGAPSDPNARLSQIDYLEVMYKDLADGQIKRSFMVRTADGQVNGPFTEVLRPRAAPAPSPGLPPAVVPGRTNERQE